MATIIIFDLDDTLVNAKMKIPRQTYHMLNKFKKINYFIGIITYNFMASIVAKETNLYKYTNNIYCANIDRHILFNNCLKQIIDDYSIITINKLYYIDDRLDNLEICVSHNKNILTYHCYDMYELYKFKHII